MDALPGRAAQPAAPARNRFDRMEWAGAFGDLGTLIPFVVAYLATLALDPGAVLFAFGSAMVVCGLVYRTPLPVQPMKAIGAVATTQAAQTFVVTAGAVYAASLVTGLVWLVLGATGLAGKLANLVARPIVVGIIVGLGVGFMLTATGMMWQNVWLAAPALAGSLALLGSRRLPAMFFLLVFGAACGLYLDPALATRLGSVGFAPRLPSFALAQVSWGDLFVGTVFLALPQLPLTLGNAILAIREENNRLFPDRPVTARGLAVSTGLLNLGSAVVGGVPMCHGAGGMAGHVRFGARSGGAPIILGTILLITALVLGPSIDVLLRVFPPPVLGVVLFLTGAQLALGARRLAGDRGERLVTLVTAAIAIWNVGAAFVAGFALYHAVRRWRKRR